MRVEPRRQRLRTGAVGLEVHPHRDRLRDRLAAARHEAAALRPQRRRAAAERGDLDRVLQRAGSAARAAPAGARSTRRRRRGRSRARPRTRRPGASGRARRGAPARPGIRPRASPGRGAYTRVPRPAASPCRERTDQFKYGAYGSTCWPYGSTCWPYGSTCWPYGSCCWPYGSLLPYGSAAAVRILLLAVRILLLLLLLLRLQIPVARLVDELRDGRCRDREADADVAALLVAAGRDLRVDADHLAVRVEQRAAGVAGVDRRVGLDPALDGRAVGRLQRAVERRDDPGRERVVESEGVADRVRGVADLDACRSRRARGPGGRSRPRGAARDRARGRCRRSRPEAARRRCRPSPRPRSRPRRRARWSRSGRRRRRRSPSRSPGPPRWRQRCRRRIPWRRRRPAWRSRRRRRADSGRSQIG